jgi:hypothetical protein
MLPNEPAMLRPVPELRTRVSAASGSASEVRDLCEPGRVLSVGVCCPCPCRRRLNVIPRPRGCVHGVRGGASLEEGGGWCDDDEAAVAAVRGSDAAVAVAEELGELACGVTEAEKVVPVALRAAAGTHDDDDDDDDEDDAVVVMMGMEAAAANASDTAAGRAASDGGLESKRVGLVARGCISFGAEAAAERGATAAISWSMAVSSSPGAAGSRVDADCVDTAGFARGLLVAGTVVAPGSAASAALVLEAEAS